MAEFREKLWNWGHLEGSHNRCTGYNCAMTPETFGEVYGIRNSFIVSYGGNIQPPFRHMAERFSSLDRVIWSVLGDASTPLPEGRLGNTQDILDACPWGKNIIGGVVDDFFSPKRMERFNPQVLMEIRKTLNARGLEFWCVLYAHQLNFDLAEYLPCFDGITFWIWDPADISDLETHLNRFFSLAENHKTMLGVYLWDYHGSRPVAIEAFDTQLTRYFDCLADGKTDGVVICSNTIGDADLDTCRCLKERILQYSQKYDGI